MSQSSNLLSFNEANGGFSAPGVPEEETYDDKLALLEPMELKTKWAFWEQPSTGNYVLEKKVTFTTAQEFWSIWNGVPQPSELIDMKRFARMGANNQPVFLEAIMIFREGIAPKWEDSANSQGGHFQLVLKPSSFSTGAQIDEYWNNLILGMLGETIEAGHRITGARLVDKLSAKPKPTDMIRVEVWYHSDTSKAEIETLRKSMEKCMLTRLDGTTGPAFKPDAIVNKPHNK
eukprot:gb/GFBE01002749.1/.p1 GENE.gb/GFBE01002749.1/~~gb/GFBE01002749.1/.p1  ORF type:complete len:232 (+),score=22.21 gb/GFBE01002749.1/:1-696(+)